MGVKKGAPATEATGSKAAPKEEHSIADWWPVYEKGTVHGPVYDEKGRKRPVSPPQPLGWLYVDGVVYDRHGQETWH